jgi:DNA (cytosine-5)-methyltransferase 1
LNRRCVSLFSGCGGLDLGLQWAGFDVVLANDNDERCGSSYKANNDTANFVLGPVEALNETHFEAALREGPIDLVAGGPPCPPYSKSRFYRKDMPRALDDPIGDATLHGYLKTLEFVRPRAFVFENVAGFAYKVHRPALESLSSAVEDLGYTATWKVLNAVDYGVPQRRERFFMVGILDQTEPFVFPGPTHGNPEDCEQRGLLPWVTAGQVLADLDTMENADDTGHFAGGRHHDLLRQVPPGENYLYFTAERGHPEPLFKWRSRYWSFLLKLSPEKPSWTIQARRSNNMGPFHWRNRILRIDEVKRLQTFPDDWILSGTIEQQWRQIGNAVPPLLAKILGDAISSRLGAMYAGE